MKRAYHTITIPRWTQREVPEGMLKLAGRRTEYLKGSVFHQSIAELLVCAYLQGINDALQAVGTPAGQAALAIGQPTSSKEDRKC